MLIMRLGNIDLPTAAELFVPSLPGLPDLASHPTHPLTLYAGSLPSYPGEGRGGGEGDTGRDAQIFFMMAKARRSAGKQRVIFWFNGGPGCSSFDGSLMEVGPFRTVPADQTESGKVELRLVDGGWEEFATIIFIDQPPGTGLSYVPTNGYLHELDEGSQHLIKFLVNFYSIFPELNGLDTYMAGESFAGQYIPYFADALLKTSSLPHFNLIGIAIGNGWIDPKEQYPGYVDFALEKGLLKPDTPELERANEALAKCQASLAEHNDPMHMPVNVENCGEVMDAVSEPFTQELNGKKVCMNVYDVRLVDDWPACGMNWPPDLPDVYTFLRREDVVSALHATSKETAWVECDNKVAAELQLRSSPAAVAFLPSILERGVQVLMFAGAEDLICNYKGLERMVNALEWEGEVGMSNATTQSWYLNDTQVGDWQTSRNLSFVKVYDSSHMVGFDVPHVTNDMILRFMDVDMSLVPGIAASSKSRLGTLDRVSVGVVSAVSPGIPLLKGGNTDWEAWYNAVSAFVILLILISIVALYFYFRRRAHIRMKRGGVLNLPREDEEALERVPLGTTPQGEEYELDDAGYNDVRKGLKRSGSRKGKERAYEDAEAGGDTVFSLGDEEDVG
ncbi:Alpha/Beta hydrolase protein [Naematelia encephala]|uniref:Pheromone-processing carboxypeptidase KEX1 n=1 Tax=Naematelia encephala TaxID=71784 RepID=A0A1Y2BLJ3_9TREE|nr:Alpha/Beta hydrolase protein [Naematelia encephala]